VRIPTAGVPHRYEPLLLSAISRQYGRVTLVNPALGTVWRAVEHVPDFCILVTDHTSAYLAEMDLIARKCKRTFEYVHEAQGIAYLGSNGVRGLSSPTSGITAWVALTPNPFQANFPYDDYFIRESDDGICFRYSRKQRPVTVSLRLLPDHDRLSPSQTDELFFDHYGQGHRYFLETNCHFFSVVDEPDKGDPVGYLEEYPPFVDGVSSDSKYVYDVTGHEQTYLSRRRKLHAVASSLGKQVAPLVKVGRFGVSYYTVRPLHSVFPYSFAFRGSEFFCLGEEFGCVMDQSSLHTSFAHIYSSSIVANNLPSPFFEGGVVSVPYDPIRREFVFNPLVPGKYFLYSSVTMLYTYQLTILYNLYGRLFRPPRLGYVNHEYEVADVTARISSIIHTTPPVERYGDGGIQLEDVCRIALLPKSRVEYYLRETTTVVRCYREGRCYLIPVSYIHEVFDVGGKVLSYEDVYAVWLRDHKLGVIKDVVSDRLADFFYYQGVPVVRVERRPWGVTLCGTVKRAPPVRYVELELMAVQEKCDTIPVGIWDE